MHSLRLSMVPRAHLIVLGISALLVAVGVGMNRAFATTGNVANLLEQAVAVGFVALGQTIVVLAGGIDLSVGTLVSALGVMLALACERWPDAAALLLPATVLAGVLVGALNATLILVLRLHSLVVTIGMAAVLGGVTLMAARQPVGSAPNWVGDIAYGGIAGLSWGVLAMGVCWAAAHAWLRGTAGGLHLLACGSNPEAARLAGLSPARSTLIAFTASGAACGMAAIYLVARTGSGDPLAGEPLTLASIAPVVIGGTVLGGGRGGVVGTLLGVLMLMLLANLLNYLNVSPYLQWMLQGAIIIAAVFFQAARKERA